MFRSILVVCTGNVCRSPIAEYLFKKYLPTHKIASAGIKAMVGEPAREQAFKVSQKDGVDLSRHCAQQIDNQICQSYDLILVMEHIQIEQIEAIAPQVRSKVMLLGQWMKKQTIPDPVGKDDEAFELVYQQIKQNVLMWVEKLG